MSKLIALVATAVVVNGERTIIQPGEPLPELHEHDQRALIASGAAQDSVAAAREKKRAAAAAEDAMADFQANREALLAAAESTAAPAAESTAASAAESAKK
ncbi:MAG: hypothetical protein E6Q67_12900 [Roseateles sp.]|nr:MAG: hypothetical protein E6Q67_12900 [Roseateles sp.]